MPERKPGLNRFGLEHAVKPGDKQLSAREVREKAEHFEDQNDY